MAKLKLTKNELREQQTKLAQLEKYLPTLRLKKAMLQAEVNEARHEIEQLEEEFSQMRSQIAGFSALLTERTAINPADLVKIVEIQRKFENIAGVEVPYLSNVLFEEAGYDLFDTPPWVDAAASALRELAVARVRIKVALEKKQALEKELREVSIRVNLFEKRLIPEAIQNISKIKVFLGDMQLAAVSRTKVAKAKKEHSQKVL